MSDERRPLRLTPPRWLAGRRGRGARIAVIDSGLDPALVHPGLRPGIGLVAGPGFDLRRSRDDRDRIGHGTACADIILRMAPEAELVPIRVFGRRLETSPQVIAAALEQAVARRLWLVNVSLGSVRSSAAGPLAEACARAAARGVVVVAAAHAAAGASLPAAAASAIGVGGGRFASIYHYTCDPAAAIECRAQCLRVARGLGGARRVVTGTSFAAPHITAILALALEPGAGLGAARALLARHARPAGQRARAAAG